MTRNIGRYTTQINEGEPWPGQRDASLVNPLNIKRPREQTEAAIANLAKARAGNGYRGIARMREAVQDAIHRHPGNVVDFSAYRPAVPAMDMPSVNGVRRYVPSGRVIVTCRVGPEWVLAIDCVEPASFPQVFFYVDKIQRMIKDHVDLHHRRTP